MRTPERRPATAALVAAVRQRSTEVAFVEMTTKSDKNRQLQEVPGPQLRCARNSLDRTDLGFIRIRIQAIYLLTIDEVSSSFDLRDKGIIIEQLTAIGRVELMIEGFSLFSSANPDSDVTIRYGSPVPPQCQRN